MNNEPKIELSWEINKLDRFLKKHFRHSLSSYAHVLAELLIESFWGPPLFGMTKTSINDELVYINKIFKDLMDNLILYCEKYPVYEDYEEYKTKREKGNFIFKNYELLPFLKNLESRENLLNNRRNSFQEVTKGRPLEKKIKTASIWAPAMHFNGKPSWPNITRLLKWFYERLRNTKYGAEIYVSNKLGKESKKIKKQCKHIIEIGTKSRRSKMSESREIEKNKYFVISMRTFFPRFSRNKLFPSMQKQGFQSIEFNKDNIEIKKISDGNLVSIKMKFIGDKKYLTVKSSEISDNKVIPILKFPDRSIFSATSRKTKYA